MTPRDDNLAPARRSRSGAAPVGPSAVSDFDDAEVARGQTVALLGALGRLQLKIDVMAREQRESLEGLSQQVAALQQRLDDLTSAGDPPTDEAPGQAHHPADHPADHPAHDQAPASTPWA